MKWAWNFVYITTIIRIFYFHKKFAYITTIIRIFIFIKNLHGCTDVSIFCAYVSKNRHFSSFSLAALNGSRFRSKYDTDHSDCTNVFLEIVKLSKKSKTVDFCWSSWFWGHFLSGDFFFYEKKCTKQFHFVPKSQILTPDRMNVFPFEIWDRIKYIFHFLTGNK